MSAYWEIGSAACPELTEVAEFDRLPAIAQAEYRLLRAGIDPYAYRSLNDVDQRAFNWLVMVEGFDLRDAWVEVAGAEPQLNRH